MQFTVDSYGFEIKHARKAAAATQHHAKNLQQYDVFYDPKEHNLEVYPHGMYEKEWRDPENPFWFIMSNYLPASQQMLVDLTVMKIKRMILSNMAADALQFIVDNPDDKYPIEMLDAFKELNELDKLESEINDAINPPEEPLPDNINDMNPYYDEN